MANTKMPPILITTKSQTNLTRNFRRSRADFLGFATLFSFSLIWGILDESVRQNTNLLIGAGAATLLAALMSATTFMYWRGYDRVLLTFGDSGDGRALIERGNQAVHLLHRAQEASNTFRSFAASNSSSDNRSYAQVHEALEQRAESLHTDANKIRGRVVLDQQQHLAKLYETAGKENPWADPAAA
ncbi:hypothetical protein HOI18_01405 [Candidatus Uhrbacteria bacterium]|nr:hypothetical protein [Candidatus Uhrbacteria bacterium]